VGGDPVGKIAKKSAGEEEWSAVRESSEEEKPGRQSAGFRRGQIPTRANLWEEKVARWAKPGQPGSGRESRRLVFAKAD